MVYEWKGHAPPALGWRYSKATMARLDSEGRIWYPSDKSKRPRLIRYLDESKGRVLDNLWIDIPPVNSQAQDRTGYRTQKPEALLERIITTSSNAGDLVLDCFVGSGTTAVVAEKLGRRWVGADLGRFAVHTTRKRLLSIPQISPFVVQNLGKYERQLWQEAEFGASADARTHAYRRFILDLYKARPIEGHAWLHGLKQGRMVHVGTVDAPVTAWAYTKGSRSYVVGLPCMSLDSTGKGRKRWISRWKALAQRLRTRLPGASSQAESNSKTTSYTIA